MIKVLKFYTPTCMPCRLVGKILDKIEGIEVIPINAEEDIKRVDEYEVFSTPTLVFLKDDKEIGRLTGMVNESKIRDILNIT